MLSPSLNHLNKKNRSFIVAGNEITISNEESDTLMRHCLALVDITDKVVCVKSNGPMIQSESRDNHYILDFIVSPDVTQLRNSVEKQNQSGRRRFLNVPQA